MKNLKKIFSSCSFLFLSFGVFAQNVDDSAVTVINSIEYNYFFKHLKYLSSDELQGRGIGTHGYHQAADYVAQELSNNSLLPYGDSGTYFQNIEFLKPSIIKNSVDFRVVAESKSLNGIYGRDVSFLISGKSYRIIEQQKLVFVGYGNIIPEEQINDYEGVDVRGKTVIVAVGGPKSIKNSASEDLFLKLLNAKNQGAAGIILYYPKNGLFQNLIFRYVHDYLVKSSLYFSDTSIHGTLSDMGFKLCAFAKRSFIGEIFRLNGLRLNREIRKKSSTKQLNINLNYSYSTNIEYIKSRNVVSILPGSDPKLKNEYVVIGAHLDHLGVGRKIKGDSIYNGMLDNAAGCAALLSIGKAFNQLPKKPKRSIIFICYTGEEWGLLGSHYFVNKNEIKNGRIVANLNLDLFSNLFETRGVMPIGYLNSNLSEAVDYSTGKLNMTIAVSKKIEEDYVERGDQFSFIRQRIPSLFILPGSTAIDSKINGLRQTNKWLKKYYHSPIDDLNQNYSDKAFATAIKLNFLTLYYIANTMENIKWNSRSWIYDRYALPEK